MKNGIHLRGLGFIILPTGRNNGHGMLLSFAFMDSATNLRPPSPPPPPNPPSPLHSQFSKFVPLCDSDGFGATGREAEPQLSE